MAPHCVRRLPPAAGGRPRLARRAQIPARSSARLLPRAASVLPVLTLIELFALGTPFNAVTERRLFRPELPIVEALRGHAPPGQPFRIVGADWYLLPDGSTWYGLEDIRGNDPMVFEPYSRFLDLLTRSARGSNARLVGRFPQPGLDFLNVRYVLTPPRRQLREPFRSIYRGPDGNLWHNPRALDRFYSPARWRRPEPSPLIEQLAAIEDFGKTVLVESRVPHEGLSTAPSISGKAAEILQIEDDGWGTFRLHIRASETSLIASSVPRSPGWKLDINRQRRPVVTINGAFVGFLVGAGHSTVTLRYRPTSYSWSLLLCVAGLAATMLPLLHRRPGGAAASTSVRAGLLEDIDEGGR